MPPPRIRPSTPPRLYLAEWREHRGLTQEQLAGRLGISSVAVSRYETLRRRPDTNVLAAIAEALGIEPRRLFQHPDAPSADELLKGQPAEVWNQALAIIRTIRRG